MTDHEKSGETASIVISGQAPLHDAEEREIYDILNKMNTVLRLFVNALMLRNRHKEEQGNESSSQPTSPTQLQQEWFDSAYQVLTGPLSGYFQVSSLNNQGGEEKGALTRLDSMKVFDIADTHLYTIKDPTVRENAQKKTKGFVSDFKNLARTYELSPPKLAQGALCLDMLYVLKGTLSGSNEPENEADRLLQPVVDISVAKFAVVGDAKVDRSESHDQDPDVMVHVRGNCSDFNAELNIEACKRDKSKFDEILRKASEQHVDSNKLMAAVGDV